MCGRAVHFTQVVLGLHRGHLNTICRHVVHNISVLYMGARPMVQRAHRGSITTAGSNAFNKPAMFFSPKKEKKEKGSSGQQLKKRLNLLFFLFLCIKK